MALAYGDAGTFTGRIYAAASTSGYRQNSWPVEPGAVAAVTVSGYQWFK